MLAPAAQAPPRPAAVLHPRSEAKLRHLRLQSCHPPDAGVQLGHSSGLIVLMHSKIHFVSAFGLIDNECDSAAITFSV